MNYEIPIIETERLRLRPHRLEDFASCAAMWADPVVTRFIGGQPLSEEDSWAQLLRYAGHWAVLGFGYWAVEDQATGAFIGDVGFADFKRDMKPSLQGLPELGWVFASRVHSKGLATEAVRAALAWGETNLTSKRTVCIMNPENVASIRVAHKCGFQEYARSIYKGAPVLMFERDLA